MASQKRMMAKAAGASLDVDHEAEQPEDSGEDSSSGSDMIRYDWAESGFDLGNPITEEEKGNYKAVTGYAIVGKKWEPAPFGIYVDKNAFPENPVQGQSYPLPKPVTLQLFDDGTSVIWTRMKWENDGWHLDGVGTKTVESVEFSVASIKDAGGVYNGTTGGSGNSDGWNNFSDEDRAKLNGAIAGSAINLPFKVENSEDWNSLKNNDMIPPVPENVKAAANAILKEKGWMGGEGTIEWTFGWWNNEWHLDGIVKSKNQQVSILVSDPTGQLNQATGKEVPEWSKNEGAYWHGIASGSFILPNPENYTDGDIYTPTDAQLEQIKEYVKETFPSSEEEDKDGSISWKFVRVGGDTANARWDLQGTYSPNYAHVYVYVSGTDVPEGANPNGSTVSDTDAANGAGASGASWYTVGEIKIPYDAIEDLQAIMEGTGAGNYVAGEARETLLEAIRNANDFTAHETEDLWNSYLSRINWFGLKVENGANDYVGNGYLTLHVNGFLLPDSPAPIVPPAGPGTGDTGDDDTTALEDALVPLALMPTRGELMGYLYERTGSPAAEAPTFTDVPADHMYADAIGWAQANGIALGYADGTFDPDNFVVASAMTAFLTRYAVFANMEMPTLTSMAGLEDYDIVDNADEILAEFFGEEYVPAEGESDTVA